MAPLRRAGACLAAAALVLALAPGVATGAVELPSGFHDSIVLSEVAEPTTMRFSPDGRIFVAEKTGRILVFDGLEDEDPEVFADLRTEVYDNGDRGLLGLALDPGFPVQPYVYALYTYDHLLGEAAPAPRWGEPGHSGDPCPKPGDADVDACPVSGRLVRLTDDGGHAEEAAGAPLQKVLLEEWCQQFSSHSVGDLQFGPEGALYVSGGDGASFNNADYGQFGWPQKNQCGDPPGEAGEELAPPDAEGGALRSQDARTPGDALGLSGVIARVDPDTGAGLPGNPMFSSSDANAQRLLAYGFRNPYRFTIDPGSGEIYVGNVGWDTYEEIDRVPAVGAPSVFNSGWPCYEGPGPNQIYAGLELDLCESLYAEPGATSPPLFYYRHHENVVPDEGCASGTGSALAGLAFYPGGPYPDAYDDALFFADPVRSCIWVMRAGEDGRPDPLSTATFMANGGLYPGVDLEVSPDGDLYYVKLFGDTEEGTIHRISYDTTAPVADLAADPRWGPAPLEVHLDASGSTDPGGKPLSFEWDLDGNGTFETSGDSEEVETYDVDHNVTVSVRVSDDSAATVARVSLYPDDSPPQPQVDAPAEALKWGVGQQISFFGSATDADEGGQLPASALYWKTRLYHCPAACHAHPLQVFPGVSAGSFTAPDHEYPAHIEISLTATDARGLSATRSVSIDPSTVALEIESDPPGVQLSAGELTQAAPFGLTAIDGANILLSAPASTEIGGVAYFWQEWSDGGARAHAVEAGAAPAYTAVYTEEPPEESEEEPGEEPDTEAPPAERPAPTGLAALPLSLLPPATDLDRHPAKQTHSSEASFSFSASAPGVAFRCKLDRGAFAPCRSPRVFRHLRPGWHRFSVVAIGPGGEADPTPASYRWRVLCGFRRLVVPPRPACARPAGSAGRAGR